MGGAIFVQHGGTLDAVGGLSIHGSTVSAGAPGATTGIAGSPGSALAPGIFLVGNGTVTMRPRAGAIQTLGDAIGDEAGTGIAPTAGAGNGPGAWALAKGGAGTLVLAAAHSHSGGTAVRAGTLLITGPGTLGAASGPLALSGGIVDLGGTTQRTGSFAQRGGTIRNGTLASSSFAMRSGVVAADLAGIGALAKTGPGTVLLSGRNTYTGGTTVRGGTLQVDGTIAGAITVDRGSLQGSGTVGDTRIDAGAALSAGDPWRRGRNAPLTIAGDLTLAAGAGYEARIAPDDAPPVRVHGTARLGGIARVTLARGGFHPERMRGHHVLLRAGALRGRFDHLAVDNLPRGLAARLRYTDTEVLLVLERE
jgi:autotransporter-associated beta strand protein